MPTLYLLCGLPGSGKTAWATTLEATRPVLRITEDEWMARLFGSECAGDGLLRARVSALQWDVASAALKGGLDVVLDWGFWFHHERVEYQRRGGALGATVEASLEQLKERLARRNADLPEYAFPITGVQIVAWHAKFEPPSADERAIVHVAT
jgi:predicted kinase